MPATNTDLLAEAKAAQHKLMTGQSVVKFRDQNGEEVVYTAANAARLATYIAELQRLVDGAGGGPMKVFF